MAEALIRQRVEDYAKAISAKDIDSVMSFFAPNLVSFDIAIKTLRYVGADNKRREWQKAFAAYSAIAYEVRDLNVTTHGELAFVHAVNHLNGTLAVRSLTCGCVGQRASGESMASGWWCTTTCPSQQTSSMARPS
jgi:ketosteroid isomerase-like protein